MVLSHCSTDWNQLAWAVKQLHHFSSCVTLSKLLNLSVLCEHWRMKMHGALRTGSAESWLPLLSLGHVTSLLGPSCPVAHLKTRARVLVLLTLTDLASSHSPSAYCSHLPHHTPTPGPLFSLCAWNVPSSHPHYPFDSLSLPSDGHWL